MRRHVARPLGWWLLGVAVGLLLGGATSFGQQYLPGPLRPFANSNSGWTLLAFVATVAITRHRSARTWWLASVLGLVLFHSLLQGYASVSTLRGFPDSYGPGDFYFVVATLAGPLVGLAGLWWWSDSGVLRAIGVAVFAAAMIGDGVSGLLRVADTTGSTYWVVSIAIGVGVLAWTVFRRLGSSRDRGTAFGLTIAGAALFVAGFSSF